MLQSHGGTHSGLMLMDGGDLRSQGDWVRQEQRQESRASHGQGLCVRAQRRVPLHFHFQHQGSVPGGLGPRVSSHWGWVWCRGTHAEAT